MDQICPKCATGICPWRDGIMCRNYVCERDDANKGMEDLLKGWRICSRGFLLASTRYSEDCHEKGIRRVR